jgi:hypothetical protein
LIDITEIRAYVVQPNETQDGRVLRTYIAELTDRLEISERELTTVRHFARMERLAADIARLRTVVADVEWFRDNLLSGLPATPDNAAEAVHGASLRALLEKRVAAMTIELESLDAE